MNRPPAASLDPPEGSGAALGPPVPVVGREAERLAPQGGVLRDRYHVPVGHRSWPARGVAFHRSVLHLDLRLEGGLLGYADSRELGDVLETGLADQTGTFRAAAALVLRSRRPLPAGAHRFSYEVGAEVGYQYAHEDARIEAGLRHFTDVRTRARLAADLSRRVLLALEGHFVRHLTRSQLGTHFRIEDHGDARVGLRAWIRPEWLSVRAGYQLAVGHPERLADRTDRYRGHDLELGLDLGPWRRWGAGLTLQSGLIQLREQAMMSGFNDSPWVEVGSRRVVPVRALLHGRWRLAPHLVATAGIGFGTALVWIQLDPPFSGDTGPSEPSLERVQDVVGHLGLALALPRRARLGLGYWHDLRAEPGPIDLLTVDCLYADIRASLVPRLNLRLLGGLTRAEAHWVHGERFSSIGPPLGLPMIAGMARSYVDHRILARVDLGWDVLTWLSLGLSYGLQAYLTPWTYPIPVSIDPSSPLITIGHEYLRHRLVARLALLY